MLASPYTQDNRKFRLTTPLGKDVLLFKGVQGSEGISQPYGYTVLALAENTKEVKFEDLIGQAVTVSMKMGKAETECHINGICRAVSQGRRDQTFTTYSLIVVPRLWTLSQTVRSRIFQQKTVPEILEELLKGIPVDWRLEGRYEPRDYCTQYRETDLDFASRLMEEEGIFYYFSHQEAQHSMVVADSPAGHDPLADPTLLYEEIEGGVRDEEHIHDWEKSQHWTSGRVTLWDHCFELPRQNLEAQQPILSSVTVGTVSHKLKLAGNDQFERYDFPGRYAQRFDGIDPNGGDRKGDLQKIFRDSERTTRIRMEQETLPALSIRAKSNCRHIRAGHTFSLSRHFNANGDYLVTSSTLTAEQTGDYRTGADQTSAETSFTCIPAEMPFRPAAAHPRPTMAGTQTAVVVGPPGEELFTDKYGRVKVQFHWDREGKRDAASSCWIRVAQPMAGRRWGLSCWPRIGQEVVVAFLEGDPDEPLIVGTVYNADQMPPYLGDAPDARHKSNNRIWGLKSNSSPGGAGYNELRFDDTKGRQQIFLHAEKNLDIRVKNDLKERVGNEKHLIVGNEEKSEGDFVELIHGNHHRTVRRDVVEKIEGNEKRSLLGNQSTSVEGRTSLDVFGSHNLRVKGSSNREIDGNEDGLVSGSVQTRVGQSLAFEVCGGTTVKSGGTITLTAGNSITLRCGGSFIKVESSGVTIVGLPIRMNSGGAPDREGHADPGSPIEADEVTPRTPAEADTATTGQKSN